MIKISISIIVKILSSTWNDQLIASWVFPNKLKLADKTPIHKKNRKVLQDNYPNVSV